MKVTWKYTIILLCLLPIVVSAQSFEEYKRQPQADGG